MSRSGISAAQARRSNGHDMTGWRYFLIPGVFDHDTGQGFFEASASPYLPSWKSIRKTTIAAQHAGRLLQQGPIAKRSTGFRERPHTRAELERFHSAAYIDELESIPVDGNAQFFQHHRVRAR